LYVDRALRPQERVLDEKINHEKMLLGSLPPLSLV